MQLGGGGQQSQYMVNEQPVEAASPISSRPPASAVTGNSDEFMRLASGGDDGAGGGEDEGDRSGGGAGGGGGIVASGGNRWPRQETLALLRIRSDMDSTFRDAPVKGPLWEDVSRKLAELGYERSAKKCREKFENVHKYYKRTKEGRVGRQDGKSYKFFSELEAFHTSPSAAIATAMDVVPVSAVIPMPVSSLRNIPPTSTTSIPIPTSSSMPGPVVVPVSAVPPSMSTAAPPITTNTPTAAALEFDFSSNSSSSSQGFNDDDEEEDELGGDRSDTAGTNRKRKRRSGGGSSTTKMMMEFLEGLMKQVMQKQESLQQRFLEAIEKREQDRLSREEAWKRQETLRLTREHELMSQERAIAASRDEAIITFLQKITGQTIQLPTPPPPPPTTTTVTIPTLPPLTKPAVAPVVPPPASIRVTTPPLNQPPPPSQQQQPPPISTEQMPLQETGGSGSLEPASSRWPKEEVLALINLRSGLDTRYQDVGPKGPLWEEISAGMLRMGYKRNAKRCKEKWENINKYYKKVKESSKKRPEDAKTCPYFHQLDALHRSKMLGGGSSSFSHGQNRPEEEDISDATLIRQPIDHQSENKTGDTIGEGNGGAAKKPGNTVRELMEGQGMQLQQHHKGESLLVDGCFKGMQFQWRE